MTLADVDRYVKLRAMAERPGTAAEGAAFRAKVASMEAEHPGIREASLRVLHAMTSEPPPQAAPAAPSGWGDLLKAAVQQGASTFADKVAGEVSGAARFEPLARGECVLSEHACGDGQVCLEIRVLARDLLRARPREKIVDGIEGELIRLAEEG